MKTTPIAYAIAKATLAYFYSGNIGKLVEDIKKWHPDKSAEQQEHKLSLCLEIMNKSYEEYCSKNKKIMNILAGENGSAGCVGHKGAMGWSGSNPHPQWIIDIIQFRNEKYREDWDRALSEKRSVEAVEKEYDTIDNALWNLSNLNDSSVKGVKGATGCCGGDHKDINNVNKLI